MGRWLALLVVLGAASSGCHRSRDAFRITQRHIDNVMRQASVVTGCPAVAMTTDQIEEHVFRVSGCGTYVDYALMRRGRRGARWMRVIPIADRAGQLACASTTFTAQGPTRYVVSGCGEVATFDLACGDLDCGWVLSGRSAIASAPPAAAAPVAVPVVADAASGIRAALAAVRTSALACTGNQPFEAQLAWDGAGHITLALGAPYRGTTVETCVAGVLSQAQIRATLTVPGAITVRVQ